MKMSTMRLAQDEPMTFEMFTNAVVGQLATQTDTPIAFIGPNNLIQFSNIIDALYQH